MFSLSLLFASIVIYISLHCVKSVQILRFFWPVFPRIWTIYYFKNLCFKSKCEKIRTRKNSVFEHFSRSVIYTHLFILVYTYLFIPMFSLYCYTNLIKLIKYGNIEITTKVSRLKSVSSIDDHYLETATGDGL